MTEPLLSPEPDPVRAFFAARLGRVYFIEAIGTNRIKIGYTAGDPEVRARSLQTACPFELRVLGAIVGSKLVEATLHRRFEDARAVPGTEWFHATPELRQFIATATEPNT